MNNKLCLVLASMAAFLGGIALVSLQASSAAATDGKLLRHVVLFNFKDDLSEAQVQEIVDAFRALPAKIETIRDFEWGTDISVEGTAAGFTHCFVVTFPSAEARDAYLPHPAHKEFVGLVGPKLEKVLVVDYWAKD